jgi:hypothetical protein
MTKIVQKDRTRYQTPRKLMGMRFTMRKAAFRCGFEAFHANLPFDPDAYSSINDQWNYERGRQFAACYTGRLKYRNAVSDRAVAVMDGLIREKAVI